MQKFETPENTKKIIIGSCGIKYKKIIIDLLGNFFFPKIVICFVGLLMFDVITIFQHINVIAFFVWKFYFLS